MTIEMKSFAISTLDDIAEGFFHARISDLPESKPCWQEIRKIRLSAAERSGRQQAANAAKQSPAEKAEKEGGLFPKESDKTAEPLGTRVFTVRRRFCRYCLSPTKQITTKLVFVVSDHYGFVVISVFCRLYLQLTELRESRHEPLSTSLCLIEKITKQMDGFRGPP